MTVNENDGDQSTDQLRTLIIRDKGRIPPHFQMEEKENDASDVNVPPLPWHLQLRLLG